MLMGRLRGEYYYVQTGPQRPVFLCDGAARSWFEVQANGGAAEVQVTYDPVEQVTAGKARWERACDMEAGGFYGVTGLRAVVRRVQGWLVLVVEQEMEGETLHG